MIYNELNDLKCIIPQILGYNWLPQDVKDLQGKYNNLHPLFFKKIHICMSIIT